MTFHFEKNSYFKETTLKKTFNMSQQNVIDSCVGTPITWLPNCDVTHAKKKKGKGAKKKTVVVKCDSFFNFFESIDAKKNEKKDKGDSDDDDKEDELAD